VHARQADGSLVPIEFGVPQEPEFFMGGGGLYGTARDYLIFLQMLMRGGTFNGVRVLRPETVALMGQNHIGSLNVRPVWKTAAPEASGDVELDKLFPGQELKWGLSFLINTKPGPGGRAAGSLAWAGLANTYFWLDPTNRVAGVILTQSLPFVDPHAIRLYGEFERGVYKALGTA
jgi:methyl acetate hydrolase